MISKINQKMNKKIYIILIMMKISIVNKNNKLKMNSYINYNNKMKVY